MNKILGENLENRDKWLALSVPAIALILAIIFSTLSATTPMSPSSAGWGMYTRVDDGGTRLPTANATIENSETGQTEEYEIMLISTMDDTENYLNFAMFPNDYTLSSYLNNLTETQWEVITPEEDQPYLQLVFDDLACEDVILDEDNSLGSLSYMDADFLCAEEQYRTGVYYDFDEIIELEVHMLAPSYNKDNQKVETIVIYENTVSIVGGEIQ